MKDTISTSNLEKDVWDLVRRLGNLPSKVAVESLKERLIKYEHARSQDVWELTASGLEPLRSSEDLSKKVTLLVYGNMYGLMSTMDDGVENVYDTGKHHSLLKPRSRSLSDKIVMYANLLQICRGDNEHSSDALTYVEDVRLLIGIFHNLNLAHETFVVDADYSKYQTAVNEIENVREFIKRRKSIHSESMGLQVLAHAFSTEAAVLFHFVNLLDLQKVQSYQVDLSDLERQRLVIRSGLEISGLRNRMNGEAQSFYFNPRTVTEYITQHS